MTCDLGLLSGLLVGVLEIYYRYILWLRGERDDLVGDLVLGWDVSGFLSPPVAVCGRRLQLRHVMSSAASQVRVMVPRESWACAVLRWRVMVLRESWTCAALLVESRSASGHRHIPLPASSHGSPRVTVIGFLCHVTVAGSRSLSRHGRRSHGRWSHGRHSTATLRHGTRIYIQYCCIR
jgi:hypothetical protein